MRRIKVVLLINNPDKIGGPTIAMRRIAESFLSQKYEFIEVHITEKLGKIPRLNVIKRVSKELNEINPDIVHITGLQLHGFYGVVSAWFAGIKNILLVVRGSSCDSLEISKINKFIFGRIIEPLTLRLSKLVYTVSIEMSKNPILKNNVSKFGGVINNPAPNVRKELYSSNKIREDIGLNDDDIVMVYTGRIVKDKGLSYALDAIKRINDKKIKFLLIGNGADEQLFKKEYADLVNNKSVYFLGRRTDIYDILFASDIFLFPTLHENLSNSLLEACTMGLPVIATKVGGNPEVITHRYDGILVEPSSTIEIIEAINELAYSPEKRELYSNRIMNKMKQSFSSKIIYNKLDELYKEVYRANE